MVFFFIFLTMPHSMWNLSSLTRESNIYHLHWKHGGVLASGPPGKSLSGLSWVHMEQVELRIHASGGTSFTHPAPQCPLACLFTFNYIWSVIISLVRTATRPAQIKKGEEGEARSYARKAYKKEVIADTIFGKEILHNCPESLTERNNPNSIIVCWCPFVVCGCWVVHSINELLSCSVMSNSLLL